MADVVIDLQPKRPDPLAHALLVAFAIGTAAAAWAVGRADAPALQYVHRPAAAKPAPPAEPPPAVEPLELKALERDDAIAINARVPFSTAPNPAARPFRLIEPAADRARAVDCLAAAMLYEAGAGDATGQRAVAQVVLNRVRHPAFPKTVCGVVFQGAERSTGCQFTFTCDGAMRRTPSLDSWKRARLEAEAALSGSVYRPVGHATHYHTDWVVPYWSASLDKVSAVGSHLFFRWAGWWGTPAAFRGGHMGAEPAITLLAGLSEAHAGTAQLADAAHAVPPSKPKALLSEGDSFIVTLDKHASPDSFASLAIATCGTRDYCKFMGWTDKAKTPADFPVDPAAIPAMSFSYLRNRAGGFEKPLWNCAEYKRPNARECMKNREQTPRS